MQYNYTQCKIILCRQIVPNGVVLQTFFPFGAVFKDFLGGCCFACTLHGNFHAKRQHDWRVPLACNTWLCHFCHWRHQWYRHLHWRFGHAGWSRWSNQRFTPTYSFFRRQQVVGSSRGQQLLQRVKAPLVLARAVENASSFDVLGCLNTHAFPFLATASIFCNCVCLSTCFSFVFVALAIKKIVWYEIFFLSYFVRLELIFRLKYLFILKLN